MANTTDKMTYGKALSYVLENCDMPSDVREKVEALSASIAKKNGAERKPTKAQTEKKNHDQELRVAIVNEMEVGAKYTADEMLKVLPTLSAESGLTTAKVNYLMRALVDDGSVVKTQEKRKTYYSLAE